MKKLCVVMTAFSALVLAVNSNPVMAQTADVSAKTNQDLERENAALRRRIQELELENAKLRDGARTTEKKLAVTTTSANSAVDTPKVRKKTLIASAAAVSPVAVYKATPVTVTDGGYYVWVDGLYERVRLPTYSLGFHTAFTATSTADLGPLQNFDPRFNSGATRGAVGYQVPGSPFRLELGGSYVAGSGSSSQNSTDTTNLVVATLLNGNVVATPNCNNAIFSFRCTVNGTLNTDYNAWEVNGKAAYDWQYGSVVVTPSATLFGGTSRANQSVTQALAQLGVATTNTVNYTANTSLRWTDVGARFGLDASVPLTSMIAVGIGGWVGVAGRATKLSGSDAAIGSPGLGPSSGARAITASDNTTVFLANAEAGFASRLTPSVTFRGFAGINYDNKVPGIANPTFGSAFSATPVPGSIYFAHETDYYVGGGLNAKFGGSVAATH
jgi:hypothetical protein